MNITKTKHAKREMPPINLANLPAMALAGFFMLLLVLWGAFIAGLIVVRVLIWSGIWL